MLRLPHVGRTVARAAKGSLAPFTTGNVHRSLNFSVLHLPYISLYCNRYCLYPAFENSVYNSAESICQGSPNCLKYSLCNMFCFHRSAGCQQYGGSVCGWETCGGRAWNHGAAGKKTVYYFSNVMVLLLYAACCKFEVAR